jgi:hypothetical protein
MSRMTEPQVRRFMPTDGAPLSIMDVMNHPGMFEAWFSRRKLERLEEHLACRVLPADGAIGPATGDWSALRA